MHWNLYKIRKNQVFTNAKLLCYNAQYEKGSEGNSVCGI